MIAIYSNNTNTDFYIESLKFQQSYQIYHSVEQYTNVQADVKIALINHLNNYDPPVTEEQRLHDVIDGRKFSQEIDQTKHCSNLVVAFDNEIHPYLTGLFRQHCQSNVYWAIPGQSNDPAVLNQHQVLLWNEHFQMMTFPYQSMPHKIAQVQCNKIKPRLFDALLGNVKPHRDFVYDAILDNNLQDQILVTYQNRGPGQFGTHGQWEPDIEPFDPVAVRGSTDTVQYQGQQIALCRILPINVYNQTAYSIVAETGTDNRYSFFTEKTAKPIIARRLFVMFSGYKFLQNLRSLGFQTFSNVIDESYDLIYNDHDRWSAAFEQVQRLCEIDQQEVFAKIAPMVEHNYNLLMSTNWTQHMLNQLQQKIGFFLYRQTN
jgi:hypothetical protein